MINWRKPVIFALLYLSGSKIPKYLKEIKKIDKFSLEEKEQYQKDKLEKTLLHAWKNVPYYHKVLSEANVVKDNKVYLENFSKIPILTKEIIRREGKNLYSKDYRKRGYYKNTSGGSTGEPVEFIQDKEYDDWNNATKIYYKILGGQGIGEKELRLWGSERDLLEGKEKLIIRLRNFLYNRKELNSFKMTETQMTKYAQIWNEFKPQWVEAYVQSIYEFGKYLRKQNINVRSPKGMVVSAGTLTKKMEKLISDNFKCPVFNRYGSREVGAVACSLGKRTLQTSFWNALIEVTSFKGQPYKDGKAGQVIVTTLNNYSMPLIRYQIGDMAIPRKYLKISNIKSVLDINNLVGRVTEVFRRKDGKIIPGEFFIHFIGVVHNLGAISKFQVIQESFEKITIKMVMKDKEKFRQCKSDIENSIKKVMGKKCKIVWQNVEDIPPTASGKYLYTVSKIK
jgi:phenylacetate-CoA ligase